MGNPRDKGPSMDEWECPWGHGCSDAMCPDGCKRDRQRARYALTTNAEIDCHNAESPCTAYGASEVQCAQWPEQPSTTEVAMDLARKRNPPGSQGF